MAATSYGVNHPLAVKLWSKKLFHESLSQTWVSKFIGKDANSLLCYQEDLQKSPGDRIRVGLRMLLTGDGVQGDGTLEGNEESLTTYYDDVVIDQLRHAVRVGGRMSEQRVPFSIREEGRMGLQDWFADRIDTWFFNQIAGNADQTDTRYTGNNAVTAPTATTGIFACGPVAALHTTEASLSATTTHALKLSDIDRAVAKAKTGSNGTAPRIRPVRVKGGSYYVLFIHPYQTYQLRNATGTTDWATIQQAAMQGGDVTGNPIFTGALGMYNNVILHESDRVPVVDDAVTANTSYRRAIFCGAQAAHITVGQGEATGKMTWVEEMFDYDNQLGIAAGQISGLKKSIFNSMDFGTIVMSGYAPAV